MTGADLPVWVAILIAVLVVVGSSLTFVGALGLVRLKNFYDRLHAPTLGTSWGTAGIALASMIFFSVIAGEVLLHELIIGIFVMITTPVGLILLAGAAYTRDQREIMNKLSNDTLPIETAETLESSADVHQLGPVEKPQ
ncbi:monovalent cation/H(+) antiporter subunit G [Ketogulonicigenium vulgare]|uniref:Monovalent cation/proton antiporter, MnhG/PhaG subunit n=1 Tax=Ketogulonicigenium vulgare (strain WSH-001) TaxID=759362 RepID=F9Y399_KETVW|nr:monovalent cation/H(+) antiporter subunit G [Ketogulonicigenium vulgare]ADO42137.1 putative monovalent cation/H+ antiporter subunit G [Ketogulonicigenium vulgare Y25]AEM40340.1 Monovalent cation/proton antiporter, MnhG/PhaG subunit [Ketogulonicigenium vulgare WSH-001]ALJ80535.1 cation:proton antiporter [Ketogulonicigenium vulgare]ANW33357.1 cation:proton antiporter [Ketogulonicigenium vulgare]AOZ54053.1 monovalent cation/H+ antiporter subunit G [Ketogulonicigenium vulgare]